MYVTQPFAQLRSVPNIEARQTVNDGVWHHVVIRRDGAANLSALVDFTSVAMNAATSPRDIDSVSSRLYIGSDSASPGSAPYVGQLRLVRIWNRRLTDMEVSANARTVLGPTPNLLFELPLDETGAMVEETASGLRVPISGSTTRVSDCIPPL